MYFIFWASFLWRHNSDCVANAKSTVKLAPCFRRFRLAGLRFRGLHKFMQIKRQLCGARTPTIHSAVSWIKVY